MTRWHGRCVYQHADDKGIIGVELNKQLVQVAGKSLQVSGRLPFSFLVHPCGGSGTQAICSFGCSIQLQNGLALVTPAADRLQLALLEKPSAEPQSA